MNQQKAKSVILPDGKKSKDGDNAIESSNIGNSRSNLSSNHIIIIGYFLFPQIAF